MKNNKFLLIAAIIVVAAVGFWLVGRRQTSNEFAALAIDMNAWSYDDVNDVYYQLGLPYGTQIESADYETLSIYVPGEYLDCTAGDTGYQCQVNPNGTRANYTAATAPVIFPVDTPGYSAQKPATSYSYDSIADYLEAGYVYTVAGMRGRASLMGSGERQDYSGGAPYGLVDLKAAIRYIRYNADVLPGNTERIFTYGMSGGGAQSGLAGATGDSDLYLPYLQSIGAATTDKKGRKLSDAILGAMTWCPITSLDIADAAYEWNLGQYATTDSRSSERFTSALSRDLASQFASLLNDLGLVDESGNPLTLSESETGIYTAGSYYDYIKGEIETSLNHFLSDTAFPYTQTATRIQIGNTEESGGGIMSLAGEFPEDGNDMNTGRAARGNFGSQGASDTSEGTTYETVEDYIAALNADGTWVTYDPATNTATIISIEDFVTRYKKPTKNVGAFDSPDASQGENNLFGNGQDEYRHFDAHEWQLITAHAVEYSAYDDWDGDYVSAFASDLSSTDELGTSMATRNDMYNPMYYLLPHYAGYHTSTPAKYWRIRTGINQTDTALTTEVNLKLALQQYDGVESVDFATVWGQPHTTAERTGTSTQNFIDWVNDCVAAE